MPKTKTSDRDLMYWSIGPLNVRQFEDLAVNLTLEDLLSDIHKTLDSFLQMYVSLLVEEVTLATRINDTSFESAYNYAFEGKWPDRIDTSEDFENKLKDEIDLMIATIEFSSGMPIEESGYSTDGGFLEGLVVVLNGFVARLKLDGGGVLWVPEIALLSRMKQASIRNALSRGELQGARFGDHTGIRADAAAPWLEKRRRFNATVMPTDTEVLKSLSELVRDEL